MEVITRTGRAKDAKSSWKRQYRRDIEGMYPGQPKTEWGLVYDRLCKLTEPTPEIVNEVIGNTSWTDIECDQCGMKVDAAAVFETSEFPLTVCHDCLVGAANKVVMEITE